MVLDALGNTIKATLHKLASAVFVNERLINELIRDLQRALLQADVNVKLVFNLTNLIKKRALEEKPKPGITQKEHLITIVYEELVKFFGEEKHGITITKEKPFKIMLVGLFGNGKCVHKDSIIPLSTGDLINAEELYLRYASRAQPLDDGFIIPLQEELHVPSFNPTTLKIEPKKVTHLWKLKGKPLLEVFLDNGNDFSVRVTPEHPFFVLRKGEVMQLRADQLTEDDAVCLPNSVPFNDDSPIQNFFSALQQLDLKVKDCSVNLKGLTKKQICMSLPHTSNYCHFTTDLKHHIAPIALVNNPPQVLTLKEKSAQYFITFPTSLTQQLAEFLGYVIGDGHLAPQYVEITNEDPEIIKRVKTLSHELFNLPTSDTIDQRTKKTHHLRISSTTLVHLLNTLFSIPTGKKGRELRVPSFLLKSPKNIIKPFLRAYFDCDGSPSDQRNIELVSESKPLIKDIAFLLLRFNILSNISKKTVNGTHYARLAIQARYAERFATYIGSLVHHKSERLERYNLIGLIQGCGKQDMIPLGNTLKQVREQLGFSIGEIQTFITSYGMYEHKGLISKESLAKLVAVYSLTAEGMIRKLLRMLHDKQSIPAPIMNGAISRLLTEGYLTRNNNTVILTRKAHELLQPKDIHATISTFKALASSNVSWVGVRKITPLPKEPYVYDLTVEDNHTFIADNIIVHNTTTIGKLAKYYTTRGYKVGLVGLDVHRPAAPAQLKQLAEKINVDCFITPGEKNPLKIWKAHEKQYNHYDIILIDTAGRDALSTDLVKEITTITRATQPQEKLLVISADIGQAAYEQAHMFHESSGITGIIITKLDGTAKGGGSLSACAATHAPIKFIGVGEKLEDLEPFNPKGFVGRLLGMGDLEALLEKAKNAMNEEEARDMSKRLTQGDFNFIDLYNQLQSMKKMGSLTKLVDMIPGFGTMNIPKDMLDVQEEKLTLWKHILDSCTREELENPDVIGRERIERIAKGSGTHAKDVRELLKQYRQSKKVLKLMKGGNPEKMMKKFGKMKLKF